MTDRELAYLRRLRRDWLRRLVKRGKAELRRVRPKAKKPWRCFDVIDEPPGALFVNLAAATAMLGPDPPSTPDDGAWLAAEAVALGTAALAANDPRRMAGLDKRARLYDDVLRGDRAARAELARRRENDLVRGKKAGAGRTETARAIHKEWIELYRKGCAELFDRNRNERRDVLSRQALQELARRQGVKLEHLRRIVKPRKNRPDLRSSDVSTDPT